MRELDPVFIACTSDSPDHAGRLPTPPEMRIRVPSGTFAPRNIFLPSFDDFGLLRPFCDALASEGYLTPTPIQSQAIPHVMAGRDLCGIAQTGTGKTAAFALPILHRLAAQPRPTPRGGCRVLVLSPTRELASQIADSFTAYGRGLPLSTAVVFGGVPLGAQQRRLAAGVDILVATPGPPARPDRPPRPRPVQCRDPGPRRGGSDARSRLHSCAEADRQAAAAAPADAAVLRDDAAGDRRAWPRTIWTDPVRVAVAPAATTVERVEQSVIFVPSERKRDLLTTLLHDPSFERVLVFTRTKHGADRVTRHLVGAGIDAAAIHGNKSQPQRERALAGFRNGNGRVLVATDIAARGIDVEGVSHVINFELPNVPEDYVHRIGRTARAGAAGTAVAFCSDDERPYLRSIEKLTTLTVPVIRMPVGLRDGDGKSDGGAGAPVSVRAAPEGAASADANRGAAAPARQKARRSSGASVNGTGIGNTRRDPAPRDPTRRDPASLPAFLHREQTRGAGAVARRGAPQRQRVAPKQAATRK